MDFRDEFKLWLSREGYNQFINYIAIDRLVNHVEVDILIPLKAEIIELRNKSKESFTKIDMENFASFVKSKERDIYTDGRTAYIVNGKLIDQSEMFDYWVEKERTK